MNWRCYEKKPMGVRGNDSRPLARRRTEAGNSGEHRAGQHNGNIPNSELCNVDDQSTTSGQMVCSPPAASRACQRQAWPKEPSHRLLPQERTTVLRMATQPAYGDLSHRILAVTAWDLGLFFVSFSSVYRILRLAGLMGLRGYHRHHNGHSLPPVRKEISGPTSAGAGISATCPPMSAGCFCICTCCSMSSPARPSTGWSAGTNELKRQKSCLRPACSQKTSWPLPNTADRRSSTTAAAK